MFESILTRIAQDLSAFSAFDVLTIGTLVLLEGILSVDNAIVLAILVRHLPKAQRRKALTYGMAGAFIFRIIAILLASSLMKAGPVQLIGGIYLLWLAMKHMFFFSKSDGLHHEGAGRGFWHTIVVVELTDIVFSIDSITTAVAMTDKILIVWLGGILGLVCLRFLSGLFVRLLDKLPKLEDLAYQIVFFVGIKLTLAFFKIHIEHKYFWLTMGLITVMGTSFIWRDYYQNKSKKKQNEKLLDQFESGELDLEDLLFKQDFISTAIINYLRDKGYLDVKKNPDQPS